jgi:predicted XRE-type DNA-binding protein
MATKTDELTIERGSGNIFVDLGLPDADELLAKSKLALAIASALKERKVTQKDLARLTGVDQSKISKLVNGKISGFSSDRLIHILTKLDQDVVITVSPKPSNVQRPAFVAVSVSTR